MKLRPGDQPLPIPNDATDCQATLMQRLETDIPARRQIGIERYGTPLQPLNGRDGGRDAYEEWLDLGVYIEQLRRERDTLVEFVRRMRDNDNAGWDSSEQVNQAELLLKALGEG